MNTYIKRGDRVILGFLGVLGVLGGFRIDYNVLKCLGFRVLGVLGCFASCYMGFIFCVGFSYGFRVY